MDVSRWRTGGDRWSVKNLAELKDGRVFFDGYVFGHTFGRLGRAAFVVPSAGGWRVYAKDPFRQRR